MVRQRTCSNLATVSIIINLYEMLTLYITKIFTKELQTEAKYGYVRKLWFDDQF